MSLFGQAPSFLSRLKVNGRTDRPADERRRRRVARFTASRPAAARPLAPAALPAAAATRQGRECNQSQHGAKNATSHGKLSSLSMEDETTTRHFRMRAGSQDQPLAVGAVGRNCGPRVSLFVLGKRWQEACLGLFRVPDGPRPRCPRRVCARAAGIQRNFLPGSFFSSATLPFVLFLAAARPSPTGSTVRLGSYFHHQGLYGPAWRLSYAWWIALRSPSVAPARSAAPACPGLPPTRR